MNTISGTSPKQSQVAQGEQYRSPLTPHSARTRTLVAVALVSILGSLLVGMGMPTSAAAQASGQQIFDGPNGEVVTSAVAPDGTIYLGGEFTQWGPQTGGGAALPATGVADVIRTMPPIAGTLNAVAPDGIGGWYVGGEFGSVGGVARSNLAHILPTGALDLAWNPATSAAVNAMVVSGTTVFVGGSFQLACGTAGGSGCTPETTRNRLAAFDAAGQLTNWNPSCSASACSVLTMALSGTSIYVGGTFNGNIGGLSRSRIAKLSTTSNSADATWNPNSNNTVRVIAIYGSDIYVGGDFNATSPTVSIGGQTRNRLAKLNDTTGAADATWNPNANLSARAIAVSASGDVIYVGGSFTTVGGMSRPRLAKLNPTTGAADSSFNATVGAGNVSALALDSTNLYAGGSFNSIGGQSRNLLAVLNPASGVADATWDPKMQAGAQVSALAVFGSVVYAGGSFTTVGGVTRNRLAAITSDNVLTDWNPNSDDQVNVVTLDGSDVYVGGTFTNVGSQERNRVAKLDRDTGAVDSSWNPNANGLVRTIEVSGSDVYVGGDFSAVAPAVSIGGQSRNRLAKLNNTTGEADATWNPDANDRVRVIKVAGSDVYVGGEFSAVAPAVSIGGQSRNRLAKLNNTSGEADTAWNPNADDVAYALAVTETEVFAAGSFKSIGSQDPQPAIGRVAKLNITTGEADATWNPGANLWVLSMVLAGDSMYVGGPFDTIGGQSTIKNVAKLDTATAALDTSWNPYAEGQVKTISPAGSNIFIGGSFTSISGTRNGAPSRYAALLLSPGASLPGAPTSVTVVPGSASATVTFTAPENNAGLTGYRLETAPGPLYQVWTQNGADRNTSTTQSLTGLTNFTNYRVRVTALGADGEPGGTSLPSPWFTPLSPARLPATPTGLSGVAASGQITASWNAVSSWGTGGTAGGYRAFALANGTTAVRICQVTDPTTSCALTNLSNGSSYQLRVRSFNNGFLFSDLSGESGPYIPAD